MSMDYGRFNDGKDATVVRNKDIPLLASTLSIMQEIYQIEQRREWQKDRMLNITQHLTGMPGSRSPRGLDDAFADLSELDYEQEKECRGYARQLRKIQKILNSIESHTMRTFVDMKYVMFVSDAEIRKELNMTRRGFDRARSCIESAPCMAAVKWQERYILIQEDE